MRLAARESALTTDQIDRPVVTQEFAPVTVASPERVERRRDVVLGVAAGVTRTAVMVAFALLAILVLVPAAIGAQADSAF
jgi:hypothetical protein